MNTEDLRHHKSHFESCSRSFCRHSPVSPFSPLKARRRLDKDEDADDCGAEQSRCTEPGDDDLVSGWNLNTSGGPAGAPSARSASSRALEMSVVASVTFTFDGTEKVFRDSTMHRRYRFRHRRLFQRHDRCVIEFMISDFGTFKQQIAIKSAELGMDLVALDYLFDDRKA